MLRIRWKTLLNDSFDIYSNMSSLLVIFNPIKSYSNKFNFCKLKTEPHLRFYSNLNLKYCNLVWILIFKIVNSFISTISMFLDSTSTSNFGLRMENFIAKFSERHRIMLGVEEAKNWVKFLEEEIKKNVGRCFFFFVRPINRSSSSSPKWSKQTHRHRRNSPSLSLSLSRIEKEKCLWKKNHHAYTCNIESGSCCWVRNTLELKYL